MNKDIVGIYDDADMKIPYVNTAAQAFGIERSTTKDKIIAI